MINVWCVTLILFVEEDEITELCGLAEPSMLNDK